ncbi:alpha/beta hydrolase [Salegentibacter sp. F188]|uniref:Alpha/beta hydrolase n=1 Tax=Autumnicola patrickiae TaxID=3075591 RepID=A0ABU3DXU4_9FLAO|nr:alpha/beta hydrolase [Salegentibacter sp. F188]MDT0688532.1 alpha/beta hydrolase [Salegentibacter sp. F188]
MLKTTIIGLYLVFMIQPIFSQETFTEEELTINKFVNGTLTTPLEDNAFSLVILIPGSGPTDRNSNQPMMKNDAFKKMAHRLAEEGISSFRYDKRIINMNQLGIQEKDIRFTHFVEDANAVLDYFSKNKGYKRIIVAGHSQGSLVGILAAKDKADAFISLAGAGRSIDKIITEQIANQLPDLRENTRVALDEIKQKGSTTNYHPFLESMFRPNVQAFLASWIQFDPALEIVKLDMPVLIINGTSDIQIKTKESELLKEARPDSEMAIIDNMNHVFREIQGNDQLANSKSYNEPNRPLHPKLIPIMTDFIRNLEK